MKSSKRGQHGFTVAEVALALCVFLMMTLIFAAVVPVTVRSAHYSNNYAQAALVAQHKIDQLRSAGYDKINCAGLQSLGIIDSATACPTVAPLVYSFTNADNLASAFPGGTTGTLTVADYSAVPNVVNPPPSANALAVTVTISWPSGAVAAGSYHCTALIINYTHR